MVLKDNTRGIKVKCGTQTVKCSNKDSIIMITTVTV